MIEGYYNHYMIGFCILRKKGRIKLKKQWHDMSGMPLKLKSNRVWRTYSGGAMLEAWQGESQPRDSEYPEEWVGSAVRAVNAGRDAPNEGLSLVRLPDGTDVPLTHFIKQNPAAYLGQKHAEKYQSNPALLVKLLDASERLTIQVHPDREFAMREFQSPFGKTEAWYILGGREIGGEEPSVLMGFKPYITPEIWKELFDKQDTKGMREALHRVPVQEGDVFIVEGGVPHAIGSGCFLIEIQEPTDYTLRTERKTPHGKELADEACHQGLGFDKMLEAFHYDALDAEAAMRRWKIKPKLINENGQGKEECLIGTAHTDRFRMHRLFVTGSYPVSAKPSFCIAIVVSGAGSLSYSDGNVALKQGDMLFLPAGLKEHTWTVSEAVRTQDTKPLQVVLCEPPL